jgi:O-antigen ligase
MTQRSGALAGQAGLRRRVSWQRHAVALLALVAYLAASVGTGRALWQRWQLARFQQRGVTYGLEPLIPGAGVDPWSINVALEQYEDEQALGASLDLLVAGGFRWVRQRFSWSQIEPVPGEYSWDRWDTIVRQCQAHGLNVIAVLDGSPCWARSPEDQANPLAPPRNPHDLAAFARTFAGRYGEAIDHYEIWDEPNIYPHWGERDVDPQGYLDLLRAARTQIRDVDPGAVLICAGLAPTTEESGRNTSELTFLRQLYEAGGRELFDVVATKPFGFWSGPEDRRVAADVLNLSRVVALHEEMLRWGDAAKPVWAVAWGWNSLPGDWKGRPSPWGTDAAWRQHDRDLRAIERAQQEWPWLTLMCYAAWQPAAPADDPIWGLALLDAGGKPQPLYQAFQDLARAPRVVYPGHQTVCSAEAETAPVEIRFWGSGLGLRGSGRWELLALDGHDVAETVTAGDSLVTVASGLPLGEHRLWIRATDPAARLQAAVWRERRPWLPSQSVAALAAIALLATTLLWRFIRPYPWRQWAGAALRAYRGLSPWASFALGAAGLGLLAIAPNVGLSVLALGVVAVLAIARADAGLMMAVFLVPLAPLVKQFGPLRFSYLEIVTLLTVAGCAGREWQGVRLLSRERGVWAALRQRIAEAWREVDALDVGFVLLLGASLLSLRASEWLRVSLREFRVVVLQAVLLYGLVTRGRLDREGVLRLADLLVLSATIVGLQGALQYAWTERVIVAEGVRRARGIYGSPNNLALVLGRVLPVMLAMVLRGPRGWRPWAYGLAAVPTAVCLFLSFSRGAWLLGVPASLLVLALVAGRPARILAFCLAIAGLIGLLPLAGTKRLSTLFSLEGTVLLRRKLWEAAWEMARDHPLFGVGLDNFLYQYPRYIRPEALSEPNLSHPHNILLDFWLRLGVPGLLALGWLLWHFGRRVARTLRRQRDPALLALAVGLLAAMADMLAHGLIDASFFVVELAGLFALTVALVRRLDQLVVR